MELFADSNRAIDALFKAIFKARAIMSHFVYNCPVLYARPNRLPILPRVSWNYCTTLPSRARIDLETPSISLPLLINQPHGNGTRKTCLWITTEMLRGSRKLDCSERD